MAEAAVSNKRELVGPCASCGRLFYVERDEDGAPQAILHEKPECAKFKELEPQDFVSWNVAQRVS